MKYNEMKQLVRQSPDLAGLDPLSVEFLIERAEAQHYQHNEVIYEEGARLDRSFCLLVSGDLIVESGGTITCGIFEQQVLGEMAYFTNRRVRTATIRVGSPEAVVLRFSLDEAELNCSRMSTLRRVLSLRTWNRFVHTSQNGSNLEVLACAE